MTSGKGGVGKSNVVVNLGLALARMGRKILLIDADLGLALQVIDVAQRSIGTVDELFKRVVGVAISNIPTVAGNTVGNATEQLFRYEYGMCSHRDVAEALAHWYCSQIS